MNKLGQVIAAAVVGVATASLVVLLRQKHHGAKKVDVEDIHRWEDEGGQALARRQAEAPTQTPSNPA